MCIKKAGVLPKECLFVGDNFHKDIVGAIRGGMHALWYHPYDTDITYDHDTVIEFADNYTQINQFEEVITHIERFENEN